MVSNEEWDLIKKRYEALPEYLVLVKMDGKDFTKKEILNHIKARDKIGEEFVERQLSYLRTLKEK